MAKAYESSVLYCKTVANAILRGYAVFGRRLKTERGGTVSVDLDRQKIEYVPAGRRKGSRREPVTIHASTPLRCVAAGAVRLLSSQGELFNLLTIVCDPCAPSHDALLKHSCITFDWTRTMRLTYRIPFSSIGFERSGTREELYSRYLSIHDRARRDAARQNKQGNVL